MVNQVLRFRKSLIIILVVVLVIWFALGRTSLLHTSHYWRLYSTKAYPLRGNARITQDFEAKYPGLYRIDLLFRNQGSENDGEFVFHLKNFCDDLADLETFAIQASSIVDGEFYPFIFVPIDDSADHRFCIVLETRASDSSTQLEVYTSSVDAYLDGAARYQENTILEDKADVTSTPTFSHTYSVWLPIISRSESENLPEFDIGFQLYYHGRILDTLKVLLIRLSAYKPSIFGTSWFYIFLIAMYLISIIWLWALSFNIKPGKKL